VPRNWQAMVEDLTDIGKKVHLSMRQDPYDVERIKAELLRERRRYYEAEITDQARRVGCGMMTARLTNQTILDELSVMSARDAASIVNTYNADLAGAIRYIRAEVPTANRFVYAKRLGAWEQKRAGWKNDQIATYTETSARSKAQQDFFAKNGINLGIAVLEPKRAVCPVCQGWVARGEVPITVAKNNPPPYHTNCPHYWDTQPDRIPMTTCRFLWMGA
jgi:hypothetical protein